ncbi:MFS transporter [Streptomonospora sp. S1-112]|uniref:MFS transporter n=1 Tax=Streptomonospora mangrovi TaxID=2883123 RepID=A0A9X3NHL1_9ACTN|nr:MFS transporter [Streptomonospora mangrovi]MDA0563333.1 MFS transporter [Streptomonospora mangrovi]
MTTTPSRRRGGGPPDTAAPLTGRRAAVVLATVLIAAFMELLDATIVSVAAPAIAADLGAGEAAIQWTMAGYTLAVGAALVLGGRLGDQFGRRRVFLLGLTGFMLASAGCGLAPDPGVLVAARVVQGLAGGLMIPQVLGIIRASFAPQARAAALGVYGAVLGLASVAGPLLGGILTQADLFGLGWRAIFWVNVPIALAGLAIGHRALPDSRSPGAARLDLPGALLAATAAVLLLLPLVQGREWGWPWWGFALMACVVPVAAVFLRRERRLARRGGHPVLDPALLRVRAFAAGLAVCLLFFGALAAPLLLGGMGLGLTAPSLINVVLAGVSARDAGAAGGVLTTVTQLGNALGVAVLGAVFFARAADSAAGGATQLTAYSEGLSAILPWQIACYVAAAPLMLLLPARAQEPRA